MLLRVQVGNPKKKTNIELAGGEQVRLWRIRLWRIERPTSNFEWKKTKKQKKYSGFDIGFLKTIGIKP
jgi:hypothetical protein